MIQYEVTDEIKGYVTLIETNYRKAKLDKISRFSVEWGMWSRKMNLELRAKPEPVFKYIFVYWILLSQLLELHFRSKVFKEGKKKRIAKEAKDIKEIILSGSIVKEFGENEVEKLLLGGLKP